MTSQEKILTIHFMGGLGNQLFQIMTASAHASSQGAKLLVSPTVHGGRPIYWDSFFLSIKDLVIKDEATIRSLTSFPLYREPTFHYVPLPPMTTNLILHGYFQSPLYFQEHFQAIYEKLCIGEQREKVRQRFQELLQGNSLIPQFASTSSPQSDFQTSAVPPSFVSDELLRGSATKPLISALHFRIGDYARYPAHHPILPVGYYEAALRTLFPKGTEEGRVWLFVESGERDWVERERMVHLKGVFPGIQFEYVLDLQKEGPLHDWEELLLMSCCPAIVMANSSFSWWGAYLATRLSDKSIPVYYPATWFGKALQGNDTKDMFPVEWHCIPS